MMSWLLILAVTVLPSDRLILADRLFNKGNYADAATEYRALVGEKSIAEDELQFRLAECDRASGKNDEALKGYSQIFNKHPDSQYAARARFMYAMGCQGVERRRLLAMLDSESVDLEIRTAALYYLGAETSNTELLVKCVKLAPKGKYAAYANLKYGAILNNSNNPSERRKGVEVLLGIAFAKGPLADEALYLAAIQSYREKKYGEAGSLFKRYRKTYPKGAHLSEARSMSAWCEFMEGKYSDAALICGNGDLDDLAYIRAACAYSQGDNVKALELFRKYLEDYPKGRYRADAELPIARIEFDDAQKADDSAMIVETAKRGFALSKLASDHLRLAWAYEKAGKEKDAAAEYLQIANKYQGSEEAAEAMYRKAMLDARENNWSAAELALAEAIATGKLAKRTAEAHYWRGVAAMKLEHEAEGTASLKKAIELGLELEQAREARLMLADYDYQEGRVEQAKAEYRKLVKEGACDRMSASRMFLVGKLIGGDESLECAKALIKQSSAEWRQAGWALQGEYEEAKAMYSAAISSYRKSLAETAKTEEISAVSLNLGKLEFRAGEFERAENTLKSAIAYNASNARARAEAYVLLAKCAKARGDDKSAKAYATVVTSLFDDAEFTGEAKKLLEACKEDKQ